MPGPPTRDYDRFVVRLIGLFKLTEGLLLVLVAVGLTELIQPGGRRLLNEWISALYADPQGRHLYWLLAKLQSVDEAKLKDLGIASYAYAALHFIEGSGLLWRQFWAEYLTVVATGGLIPLEVYELTRRFTVARLSLLGANGAVVVYLILNIRRSRRLRNRVR
jgi:uncharacterized membrane protein (DUF2068 family)